MPGSNFQLSAERESGIAFFLGFVKMPPLHARHLREVNNPRNHARKAHVEAKNREQARADSIDPREDKATMPITRPRRDRPKTDRRPEGMRLAIPGGKGFTPGPDETSREGQ